MWKIGKIKICNSKGEALILAYIMVVAFSIASTSLIRVAINQKHLVMRERLTAQAFYLAEGCIEDAIFQFTSGIANYTIAPDIETFDPAPTAFATFHNASFSATITRLESSDRTVTENQTSMLVRNYEVDCSVTHPQNNTITVTVHQIIARRLIPTFQHAVFYNDDLEVLPGSNMTLSGRIHCNQNIYLDAESGIRLTIDSTHLYSAGNIYNQRKDSGNPLAGEVSIRENRGGAPRYADMNNLDSDSANWTTESVNRWNGTVQNAVHGVTSLTAPAVASIQQDGYYETNAGVVITNNQITRGAATLIEGVDYPAGTVTTTTTLYNNREGGYIKTTNVDLKKLAGYAAGDPEGSPSFPNNLPGNGLLYATRDDAGGNQPGIRLVNGSKLYAAGGLTVVSDDPVYMQGDYNTTDEKPASVMCDSLNILSNNWNDANSSRALASRSANTTTINCAVIAGVDTTSSGRYNGGLENYPRLHENWSSIQLNIKGSFVELWNSHIAAGAWRYGSPQYTAPRRNWSYNTNFNNISNLPPFTPWAVEAQRIAWWKE